MKSVTLKSFIYSSEANILGIISNSLVHRTGKVAALKLVKAEILRISSRLKLSKIETNRLWLDSYKMYLNVSRKVVGTLMRIGYKRQEEVGYSEVLRQRIDATYSAVHKLVVQPGLLERQKNELVRNVEHRLKRDELYDPVKGIIRSYRDSPFWICSAHAKPAFDHRDHEGKLYFNADWFHEDHSEADKARARKVIRARKMISVQEITGAPVYLTVRPNCRHFFIPVEIDEVIGHSNKELLKEHKGYIPNESPISYEKRQFRVYYDRLKVLLELRNITPCAKLDKDIKETRKLCRIWADRAGISR